MGSSGSFDDFKASLRLGPLTICYETTNEFFQYSSGVFDLECNPGGYVTHAMAAIGYGYDEESGLEYALIRNSWGKGWGEEGNVRIAIRPDEQKGGQCLLYSMPAYP